MSFFNIFPLKTKIEHLPKRTYRKNPKNRLRSLRQMVSLGASCSLQKTSKNIDCPNCGKNSNSVLFSSSNTFRLLGSSILQYRKHSFVICPYCGNKIKTDDHK